jgi:hypothetical protein
LEQNFRTEQIAVTTVAAGAVPTPSAMAAPDLVLVCGPLRSAERALELAGALKLALDAASTIAFAYGARFEPLDVGFAYDVARLKGQQTSGSVHAAATYPAPHPAFREYMLMHGQNDQCFEPVPEGAEVLAHMGRLLDAI